MKNISLYDVLFGVEEPNKTEKKTEKDLIKALEIYLNDNDPEKFEELLPNIKKLIQDQFEEIKSDKLIFRGICLPLDIFKKMFWSFLDEKGKELFFKIQDGLINPTDFVKIKNVKLKPKKGHQIQSWTGRKDIALSFAGAGSITVVFVAKMNKPNLFFGKPGQIAKAIDSEFLEEMESISIGNVVCEDMYFGPTVANLGIQQALKSKIFDSNK